MGRKTCVSQWTRTALNVVRTSRKDVENVWRGLDLTRRLPPTVRQLGGLIVSVFM